MQCHYSTVQGYLQQQEVNMRIAPYCTGKTEKKKSFDGRSPPYVCFPREGRTQGWRTLRCPQAPLAVPRHRWWCDGVRFGTEGLPVLPYWWTCHQIRYPHYRGRLHAILNERQSNGVVFTGFHLQVQRECRQHIGSHIHAIISL